MDKKILNLDIEETTKLIDSKQLSLYKLNQFYLERIKKFDKSYNCFLTLNESGALRYARRFDNGLEKRYLLPFALKDNIVTSNLKTTCASKMLENFVPPFDATVSKKLKGLGGVVLGKTNLDEFAHGSSTEHSFFGPTHNPYDRSRVPGGSSGGSAAAVALRFCHFALGSDTGGSIRQPAAFCGVVGLKPTYGRVSRFGLVAMASSMDQIGPITRCVKDSAKVLEYISGFDPLDATSSKDPLKLKSCFKQGKVKKIGVPREFFGKGLQKEVRNEIIKAVDELSNSGYKIIKLSLPHAVEYSLAVYYLQQTAETSSNLARYDGIKYGYSAGNRKVNTLYGLYAGNRGEGFGEEVKRRIILGSFVLSAGYKDAYYKQAAQVRGLIKKEFDQAFEKVEVILTPTTPTLPFKLGERTKAPLEMYMADLYTVPANLVGIPAISIPCGFVNPFDKIRVDTEQSRSVKGLPVGLQLISPAFREDLLFEVAYNFEQKHNYHLKRPNI